MTRETSSAEATRHALQEFWIRNNIAFLTRYWFTAHEALQKVLADPEAFTEFQGNTLPEGYVSTVISNHREHHNYSGVLLTYAILDEFMITLTAEVGRVREAPIRPSELRGGAIDRYKKFIHKVCRVDANEASVDWPFLNDFAEVRNAIIHANGNKSLVPDRKRFEGVVARHSPLLGFKHGVRLAVSDGYVAECITITKESALTLNDLTRPKLVSRGSEDPSSV